MNIFFELRKERGLTQAELAMKLNIKQNTVSRWEKGISLPDYPTLIRIADLFNVTIDYLLGRSDELGVIESASGAASLSSDEKELLQLFEALGPFERETFLIQLRAIAKRSSVPSDVK